MDGRDFNLIKCLLSARWCHKGRHRQTPTARRRETKKKRMGLKTETKVTSGKVEIMRAYSTV